MDDKELFSDEFNKFYDEHMGAGLPNAHKVDCYTSWLAAKRSQPIVVLPESIKEEMRDIECYPADETHKRLASAGIKYTIGE